MDVLDAFMQAEVIPEVYEKAKEFHDQREKEKLDKAKAMAVMHFLRFFFKFVYLVREENQKT